MIASMQTREPEVVTDWVEVSDSHIYSYRIVRLSSRFALEMKVHGGWESRGTVPAAVVEELEFRRDLAEKLREELLARIQGKVVEGKWQTVETRNAGYPGIPASAFPLIEVQEPLQPAQMPPPAKTCRKRRVQGPRLPTIRTAQAAPEPSSQPSLVERLRIAPAVPLEESPLRRTEAEIRSARCRAAWVTRKKRFGPSGRSS